MLLARYIITALLFVTGCSYVLVPSAPKNYKPTRAISCNEAPLWPTVDAVIGISAAVSTVAIPFLKFNEEGQVDPDGEKLQGPELALVLTNTVVDAVVFGLSARHGFIHTRRCRDARVKLQEAQLP